MDELPAGLGYLVRLSPDIAGENVNHVLDVECGHLINTRAGHAYCSGGKDRRTGPERTPTACGDLPAVGFGDGISQAISGVDGNVGAGKPGEESEEHRRSDATVGRNIMAA